MGGGRRLGGAGGAARRPTALAHDKDGRALLHGRPLRAGRRLVFGSETAGLPRSLLDAHADHCLRIPMRDEARSLNLSVSVAVVAYEALRQGQGLGPRPP